jgi:hypothetical protein
VVLAKVGGRVASGASKITLALPPAICLHHSMNAALLQGDERNLFAWPFGRTSE